MNHFASYGTDTGHTPRRPRKDKQPTALDLRMEEKQRLHKRYRLWVRDNNRAALAAEPRLVDFMRYLRTVRAEQAGELIDAIRNSWLPEAPLNVRIYALKMVDQRANTINRDMGNEALDDPMPSETSVYFQARDILHPGGRL